jgi:hypothetical protein
MVMRRGKPVSWFAATLLSLALTVPACAEQAPLDTLKDIFVRLHSCWKPPPLSEAKPIDITVVVSFNREGVILGHPRITYESEQGSDNDRLAYRVAVMQTLQRCTPLPFSESLGGAVAGRPLAIPFRTRKREPRTQERQAWLPPKIL